MKIQFTRIALNQLDEILNFIAAANPGAAKRVQQRIARGIKRLSRFPYLARMTDQEGIRVLPIVRYPYLVFYSVDKDAKVVTILRIRHSARDPKMDFK